MLDRVEPEKGVESVECVEARTDLNSLLLDIEGDTDTEVWYQKNVIPEEVTREVIGRIWRTVQNPIMGCKKIGPTVLTKKPHQIVNSSLFVLFIAYRSKRCVANKHCNG